MPEVLSQPLECAPHPHPLTWTCEDWPRFEALFPERISRMELISGLLYQRPENQQERERICGRVLARFRPERITEHKRISDPRENGTDYLIADFHLTDFEDSVVVDVLPQEMAELRAQAYARVGIAEFYLIDVSRRRVLAFRHKESGVYTTSEIHEETGTIWPIFFVNGIHGVRVRDILPSRVFYVKER
ncbi:hypothetical protein [Armatimonas rosea]|uniref:Uma2 family endonuclease n=1 Tax=Armatimonas rosea TaxID=685828 RepID=A0A7W9SVW8_ARMRO|nr:hypothetical protein [Armatimonas rosea]MBB6052889.1 hypothetical protein [Armatimonas rosea]